MKTITRAHFSDERSQRGSGWLSSSDVPERRALLRCRCIRMQFTHCAATTAAKCLLADALSDPTALDVLRPLMVPLSRLSGRASNPEMVSGNAVMATALQGYGMLKLSGRGEGLERESILKFTTDQEGKRMHA